MSLIGTSLNAVTATGPGAVIAFDRPRTVVAEVAITGSPSSVQVNIEGSLDGVNFFAIQTELNNVGALVVSSLPVLFTRANVITLSGGSSPTVTAIIAAQDWS